MTRIAWHSRTRSEQGAFRLFKDKQFPLSKRNNYNVTNLYCVVNMRTAPSPSIFMSLSIKVTSNPCLAAFLDNIVGGN